VGYRTFPLIQPSPTCICSIRLALTWRSAAVHLASNSVRAFFTCFQFCATQSTRPCIGRNKLRPRVVSSYSTRRGTSGNNSLVSNPSRSRFRSVKVSILCEMPGIDLSSSENRARPPGSFAKDRIKKMLHLSPTFVDSSRTAIRWRQGQYFTAGTSGILSRLLRRRCI
jgi:hypothetical protein